MPSAGTAFTSEINPREMRELRKTLRVLKPTSPEYLAEFKALNKRVGQIIAQEAQSNLEGFDPQSAAAASRVQSATSATDIKLKVSNSGRVPFALAAVYGMKRRTGWYAQAKYQNNTARQTPPWVGSAWEVGKAGEGPYGLNAAIDSHLEEALEIYGEGIETLMDKIG